VQKEANEIKGGTQKPRQVAQKGAVGGGVPRLFFINNK